MRWDLLFIILLAWNLAEGYTGPRDAYGVFTVTADTEEVRAPASTFARRLNRNRNLGAPTRREYLPEELPPEQWFDQTLDHFEPSDLTSWKQRFWVNDSFHRPGGPAFLMIGGEGEATPIWMVEGAWIDYAKHFGAICFQLEHRFYGRSRPTPDMSVKNLQYLSSEQALADLATFVSAMNERFNLTDSKWISFGGSYPGSLSAWFRLKYPHLVHGAVSTSGPLLAKANFYEYLQVVSNALDVTNPSCNPDLKDAIKKVEMLTLHPIGWKTISKLFNLCEPFNGQNADDVSNFFEALVGNFEDIVQYNRDNRAFEGSTNDNVTIDTLCDIMTDKQSGDSLSASGSLPGEFELFLKEVVTSIDDKLSQLEDGVERGYEQLLGDTVTEHLVKKKEALKSFQPYMKKGGGKSTLKRLADVNDFVLKMNGERCLDINYANMVKELKQSQWPDSGGVGIRQWTYQTCTEFGWYQTSDQPSHPYSNHFGIDFQERICTDVYGARFNRKLLERAIDRSNIMYGAKNIKVTNVVFVHGSIDPWHAMGITQDLTPDATAIYITGTAHCANMYPEREDDLPQLKMARRSIQAKIAQWLEQ